MAITTSASTMAPPWVMLMVVVLAHRECEHTCGSNTPHPKVDGKWGVVTSKCVHSTPSGKKLMDIEYYTSTHTRIHLSLCSSRRILLLVCNTNSRTRYKDDE
ncbi:hypothetical protein PF005_g30564 [Phytophthora fragariae]|uniref:Pectate lyase n=2 Tax=Phytophthora fragariae TaxID=53985 RepID=A0A6A3PJJ8_9STRA|nr:hypothetical protein PF003_g36511 [Phytophthora fragariae]KAE8919047.1 hypothetical protein PF009_g30640 [Phytophthora fragariae]KAE8964699.1 hypothetical protein PF011_g28570 [Phytophthora fragariae]KAE9061912.1 hypothetical protein PF007_g30092 [Phytophthora fragariae]KAE9066153.1 hypothetical protein PF006_g30306 [Phytophthora fragariae]